MKKLFLLSLLMLACLSGFSQICDTKYGATEDDSLQCVSHISMFRIHYQGDNHADAYNEWRKVVEMCPCSWSGIFSYSHKMLSALIKEEQDSVRRELLIDTLLWTFDNRHLYFPKTFTEGSGLALKAVTQLQYKRVKGLEGYQNLLALFGKAIDMEQESTQPNIWDTYFKVAENITKATKDTTIIIEAYERATTYIELGINQKLAANDKHIPNFLNLDTAKLNGQISENDYQKRLLQLQQDTARNNKFVNVYKKVINNIEIAFTPYAPCNVLEKVYAAKMETPLELNAYKKMLHTLNKSGCLNNDVYINLLGIVHAAEPSAQTAYFMGIFSLSQGKTDTAITFFNEAIAMYDVNEQKAQAYYRIGLANYLLNKYSDARKAAREALKLKPDLGVAYMLIGDLYAASGSQCSGETECPLAFMWAAADKYGQALKADPSLSEQIKEKRSKLQFPSGDDKFVRGLNPGDSYKVGCWIQETTTVR